MVSNAEFGPDSVRGGAVVAAPPEEKKIAEPVVLEVGFDQVLPWPKHIALSVQNMLVLAGLFLFPGLFAAAYHLSSGNAARLYGAAFVAVGFGTVLQGVLKLRMPIVLGPWSATLAGLLVIGKLYGLGTAFGSLTVAAAILAVLSVPVRGVSIIRLVAKFFSTPALSGGIVLITGIGLEQIAVVNWAGKPGSAGFGAGNWTGGLVALLIVAALFAFTRGFMRALAMILGIIIGSLVFSAFAPISFKSVAHGPWISVPSAFQFGFGVNATALIVFLVLLIPPFISAMGFYSMVGEWGGQRISGDRMAWGAFGLALSGVLAGAIGTFSTSVYPENVGLLRSSRVGSRWVTVTAGALFIVVGFIYKIGAIFAAIPSGIIGAAAVAMFAVIMMAGIEILAKEEWTPRNIMVVGLPTVLSVGGVFLSPDVYASYPLLIRELITQPLVTGPFLLLLLFLVNKAIPARFGQAR
jgi:xanthine/uracil permease